MAELILERDKRLELRGAAHHLKPVVLLGARGLTDAGEKEVERALDEHGLIKIHVPSDDREERDEIYTTLADKLNAARIQAIGKMLVLWREPKEEVFEAPGAQRRGRRSGGKAAKEDGR